MKIRNILCAALIAVICAFPLVACANNNDDASSEVNVSIYAPEGAPALALGYALENFKTFEFGDDSYSNKYTVVSASDISGVVTSGTADVAVMPINAAANLYTKNSAYVALSVVTHGNLYVIGRGVNSLDELKGRVLGVIGNGNVPDLVLRALLNESGIEFVRSDTAVEGAVALRYYADGSAVIGAIKSGIIDIALMAEPAVSTAVKATSTSICIDIQKEWGAAFGGTGFPQAALIAKKTFADANGEYLSALVDAIEKNDEYAGDNLDAVKANVAAVRAEGVVSSLDNMDAESFERSNVYTKSAASSREEIEALLNGFIALSTEEQPILTALPNDGFYYSIG